MFSYLRWDGDKFPYLDGLSIHHVILFALCLLINTFLICTLFGKGFLYFDGPSINHVILFLSVEMEYLNA